MSGGRRPAAEPGGSGPPAPGSAVVLLDTNAVLLPFREGLPLERELLRLLPGAHIEIPRSVLRELAGLAARGAPHAAGALEWARRFPRREGEGRGDPALLALARASGAAVVTGDRGLLARLLDSGLTVLQPRGRRRLALRRGRRREEAAGPTRGTRRRATVKNRAPLDGGGPSHDR